MSYFFNRGVKDANSKLEDELDSVWSMMDELREADIKNWSHLVKNLQNDLIQKSLTVLQISLIFDHTVIRKSGLTIRVSKP